MPYRNYKSTKRWSAPPAALAGAGFGLLVLVVAWMFLTEIPDRIRHPLPEMTLAPSAVAVAPAAEKATPFKVVYRNSVIPGGVHSAAELSYAVQRDPVIMAHYADFDLAAARLLRVERSRLVHVSYRIGDKIYWTKKKVRLALGESLLSDGKHLVRTRCGNRIADEPEGPVFDNEPAPEVLDAVFVSAEDLIDEALTMATGYRAPSPAPATVAATVAHPLLRFASGMQDAAPVPAIVFPNLWNVHTPVSWAPAPRVDALAFAPPVVERFESNVLSVVVNVDQPVSAVIGEQESAEPRSPVTQDVNTPRTPEQDPPAPFTPPPTFGPQVITAIDSPSTPTPVPEPGSAALIGLALITLILVKRGKRNNTVKR